MKIERVTRWHWAGLALLVGLVLSQINRFTTDRDPLSAYDVVGDQKRFENMLLDHDGDTPRFRDLTVHVYGDHNAVSGRYFDGPKDAVGRMLSFEAATPFPPGPAIERVGQFGHVDLSARYKAIANPSIRDYLSLLGEFAAIDYQYAWWEVGWINTLLWTAGGLILIGGIWPTIINLLVYHRWTRPKEAKGVSLRNVSSQKPLSTVQSIRDDAQTLAGVEEAMLANLESSKDEVLTKSVGEPAGPPPIRALDAAPLKPTVVHERDDPHFAIKSGDFYPTEHHEPASDPKKDKSRHR